MSEYRQTLVASVGGQPQIVTLTLDLLLRRGMLVSEVIVLHPSSSDARIRHTLHCLRAEFVHDRYTCDNQIHQCHLQLHPLSHRKRSLADVNDPPDAQATRDAIHRLLRQLKQQQRHVHLSASGGRRIISLLAVSAALLHLDHSDHIWHIHTPPAVLSLVKEGAMMHVPPEAGVELIEVPFVPWGAYFPLLSAPDVSAQETQRTQTAMLSGQERARCAEMLSQATKTQQHILRCISTGLTPRDIAAQLHVSIETVYSHTKALLGLARPVWCIPEKEKINYHFLFLKFSSYFQETG